jgi:hypothetical protein
MTLSTIYSLNFQKVAMLVNMYMIVSDAEKKVDSFNFQVRNIWYFQYKLWLFIDVVRVDLAEDVQQMK